MVNSIPQASKAKLSTASSAKKHSPSWKENVALVAADASTFWAMTFKNWKQIYPNTPLQTSALLEKTYLTPKVSFPMLAQSIITYPLSNSLETKIGKEASAILSGTLSGIAETLVSQTIAGSKAKQISTAGIACMITRDCLYIEGYLSAKETSPEAKYIAPSLIATGTLPLDVMARNLAIQEKAFHEFIPKMNASFFPRIVGVNLSLLSVLFAQSFFDNKDIT